MRSNLKRIQEVQVQCLDALVSQTDRFALYMGIDVDIILEWDS
ncbi:uncharacterized protein G2W53_003818 [Senna tora]|uniref:Uncharacterized protein n=1 Tax=Senna tora TaxID=362788 RepID=A0A834XBF3_9FABA|nr:uncharacterized protein G2W53_003818 [Senna tora]